MSRNSRSSVFAVPVMPAKLAVETEVVLERDRGERLILAAHVEAFFGFDRLMDTLGIAAAVHQSAGELIDDDDFAILDDVLLILVEQMPRLERRVELMRQLEVALIVEVGDAENLLDFRNALFRDRNGVRFFIDREIFVAHEARQDLRERRVQIGRVVALAADDQRRARFVDEDRIDFVDDREVQLALHHLIETPRHVIAQVVEADLVVGDVGDVAQIRFAPRGRIEIVLDDADRHAERAIQRAHPLGIAFGEIIVDGDDVHALARERVEIDRQRGDERLALAGAHLGNVAFVQRLAAHQLNVEVAHPHDAFAGLAHDGERLDEQIVDRRAAGQPRAELDRLRGQLLIGECGDLGFEEIDASRPFCAAGLLHARCRRRAS